MFQCLWELLSTQTIWSCLIVAAAAFLQATVGFAAAMFGLPLLMWVGNSFLESQVLVVAAMLPQNIFGLWKLRGSIDFREVALPVALRTAAMPIGVVGLAVVMTWPQGRIQQLVGGLILLAIGAQSLIGTQWRSARHPAWMVLVFGGSGILQGLSGMSAPPMILWVHAQRFSHDRARAFLFAIYCCNFAPQMVLLWWRFGNGVFYSMSVALLALPGVLLSATVGLRLGSRLGDRWMRPAVLVLLLWISITSLLQPWLQATDFPIAIP